MVDSWNNRNLPTSRHAESFDKLVDTHLITSPCIDVNIGDAEVGHFHEKIIEI